MKKIEPTDAFDSALDSTDSDQFFYSGRCPYDSRVIFASGHKYDEATLFSTAQGIQYFQWICRRCGRLYQEGVKENKVTRRKD